MPRVDGRGSSGGGINEAIVDATGRLHVEADTRPIEEEINEDNARAWAIVVEDLDPTDADDYFLYIKNTGEKSLELYEIEFETTVVGSIELHHVTGTASGDSDPVPVNHHLGRPELPTATITQGVNITGLTISGLPLSQLALATANETVVRTWSAHWVIPKDQAVALLWDTATGILSGTMYIFEREV